MAEIPQSDPCSACPFRKKSLKGYTGPHKDMAEILGIVHYDGKFPRVNSIMARETKFKDPGEILREAAELAPWCTGALAHMNNSCKRVDDPTAAKYASMIGRRDDVFENAQEAMLYHDGKTRMLMPPGFRVQEIDLKSKKRKRKS